jgi:hypothetical protein
VSMTFFEMTERYPEFTALMTASFNYDWRDDFADVEALLQSDVFSQPPEHRQQLLREIDAVLESYPSDEVLGRLLADIGSGFAAAIDAPSGEISWMSSLVSRLRTSLTPEAGGEAC